MLQLSEDGLMLEVPWCVAMEMPWSLIFGHTVEMSIERKQVEIFFKRIQNNLDHTHPLLMQQACPLKFIFLYVT